MIHFLVSCRLLSCGAMSCIAIVTSFCCTLAILRYSCSYCNTLYAHFYALFSQYSVLYCETKSKFSCSLSSCDTIGGLAIPLNLSLKFVSQHPSAIFFYKCLRYTLLHCNTLCCAAFAHFCCSSLLILFLFPIIPAKPKLD